MFSIIISEKGGAERRESFDKTEINVGRVQGNDLMLPKGNVSKRHARLLFRDGRFIVTDLKSTNGTYVNGRKIAQATIVREGDKIYIGDFVLRIEVGDQAGAGAPAPAPQLVADESSEGDVAAQAQAVGAFQRSAGGAPPPLPGAPTAGPPPMPVPMPSAQVPPPAPVPVTPTRVPDGNPLVGPPAGAPQPMHARETALGPGPSALPLPAQQPSAPPPLAGSFGAPPAPIAIAPAPMPTPAGDAHASPTGAPPPPAPVAPPAYVPPAPPAPAPPAPAPAPPAPAPIPVPPPPAPAPMPAPPAPVAPPAYVPAPSTPVPDGSSAPPLAPAPSRPEPSHPVVPSAPSISAPASMGKISAPPPAPASIPASSGPGASARSGMRGAAASEGVVDANQAQQHRAALARLMEKATAAVDTQSMMSGEPPSSALAGALERALSERAAAMRAAGELPPGLEADVLVAEARRELFELGPIGPLLDDEYVEEVQVIRHDHVVALAGQKQVATEIAFSSEAAVARVVRRIAARAGRPLTNGEVFVERRVDRGARMFAVLPPASGDGHMIVIRKPQRALATLDELVRTGTLSRAMATLLANTVQGRANILVTGGVGSGATGLLGALAGAGNIDDRVVVLQEDDELIFNQPHTVSMLIGDTAEEGARAVHAAIRVRPDRLVVGAFAGHVVAEVVDAIGDGVDGVLASARAPTLRHLVARVPADLAATKRMLALDTAREWLASSFDLVVEVARLRDGRQRAMRVAEFTLEPGAPLGLRDIFTFTVERTAAGGTLEGSFQATGVVPRVAEDLVSRGFSVDTSIFKRPAR